MCPPVRKWCRWLGRYRSADIDFYGDVPSAGAAFGKADHHQAEHLKRLGHLQVADIERTQPETLDEGRDARPGLRIVGCDERVEASALCKDMAEDGVERLHDMRAGWGALGDLLCTRTAGGGDEAREVGATGLVTSKLERGFESRRHECLHPNEKRRHGSSLPLLEKGDQRLIHCLRRLELWPVPDALKW